MAEQKHRITIRFGYFAKIVVLIQFFLMTLNVNANTSVALFLSPTEQKLDEPLDQAKTGRLGLQSREALDGMVVTANYLIYDDKQQHLGSYVAKQSFDLELPEGSYSILAVYAHSTQKAEIEIKPNRYVERQFIFDKTSELVFSALQDDDPVMAHFSVFAEDGKLISSKLSKQSFKQRLPLGNYRLVVNYQDQEQTLDLKVSGEPHGYYWLMF